MPVRRAEKEGVGGVHAPPHRKDLFGRRVRPGHYQHAGLLPRNNLKRPNSVLGFQAKVLHIFQVVPSSLRGGRFVEAIWEETFAELVAADFFARAHHVERDGEKEGERERGGERGGEGGGRFDEPRQQLSSGSPTERGAS